MPFLNRDRSAINGKNLLRIGAFFPFKVNPFSEGNKMELSSLKVYFSPLKDRNVQTMSLCVHVPAQSVRTFSVRLQNCYIPHCTSTSRTGAEVIELFNAHLSCAFKVFFFSANKYENKANNSFISISRETFIFNYV